jgi:hypothetical protein
VKPYVPPPGTIPFRALQWMSAQQAARDQAGADRFLCSTAEFNAALDTGMDDSTFITCLKKARDAGLFHVGHDKSPVTNRPRLVWSLGDGRRAPRLEEDEDEPLHEGRADVRLPAAPASPFPTGERVSIEKPAADDRPYRGKSGRPPAAPPAPPAETGPGWKANASSFAPPPAPIEAAPPPPPRPPAVQPWQLLGTTDDGQRLDVRSAWPLIEHGPRPSEFLAGRTDGDCLVVERDGIRVRYTAEETRVIAKVTRGLA